VITGIAVGRESVSEIVSALVCGSIGELAWLGPVDLDYETPACFTSCGAAGFSIPSLGRLASPILASVVHMQDAHLLTGSDFIDRNVGCATHHQFTGAG